MQIYISARFRDQDRIRKLAASLREAGHLVYDFTNENVRVDPDIGNKPRRVGNYWDYLINEPAWVAAQERNRAAMDACDCCILLLPSGVDSHADYGYCAAKDKMLLIVGTPERHSPVHLWADAWFDTDDRLVEWSKEIS